jgi:hypothetical protein
LQAQPSEKKKWWYASEGAMWRIVPLLGKDLEKNETTAVAMHQHGKHVCTTKVLLLETVFSVWSVQRSYLKDNSGSLVISCEEFCIAVKIGPECVKLKNLHC